MHALSTAILRHTTATGTHYDWLIEDPTLPNPHATNARLWTARVTPPPTDWPRLKRFDLTVIPPHRRHYLTYQGPVSQNRGHVTRLVSGTCYAKHWTPTHIHLTFQTQHLSLALELHQQSQNHWLAIPAPIPTP